MLQGRNGSERNVKFRVRRRFGAAGMGARLKDDLSALIQNARKYTDVQAKLGGYLRHVGPVFRMGSSLDATDTVGGQEPASAGRSVHAAVGQSGDARANR